MRSLVLVLCLLLFASFAVGQTTAVTVQVTDTGGQIWFNGSYSATLTAQSGSGPVTFSVNGVPLTPSQTQLTGTLDSTGSATFNLTQNPVIQPVNTIWTLVVCPQATATCYTTYTTASGASQSVPIAPPPIVVTLANPPYTGTAYQDSEVTGVVVGSNYYNLTLQQIRICTIVSGSNCTNWINASGGGSVPASGTPGNPAGYTASTSIGSEPLSVDVDLINGAGIGQASVAWTSGVTYPACQIVSLSGLNYIAPQASANITPGTNKAYWYPIPNASRPTKFDCAYYTAASRVTSSAGQLLRLGQGVYNSCIGMVQPTVTSPGNPTVSIRGGGPKVSTINQTCTLNAGSGGDGLPMFIQPESTIAFALARFEIYGVTFEANGMAPAVMEIHGAQESSIEHVDLRDAVIGADHYFECGETSHSTKGWCFEMTLNDIDLGYSLGHGGGATLSTSVSGGVPTITVSTGGTNYTASTVAFLTGPGNNNANPCSSMGTTTPTIVSGVITAVTTSATGCVTNTYAMIMDLPAATYGFKFSNMTDSHFISGLTVGGVGSTAGVYVANVSSANTFYKTHPINTYVGIEDHGINGWISTQIDSVYRYGFDFEAQGGTTNVYDTLFEWNASTYLGSSDYYFGPIVNPPVNAPYAVNIYNDRCGNQAHQAGYVHLITSSGSIDAGGLMPSFINIYGTQYCNHVYPTEDTPTNYIGQIFQWSNGKYGNVFQWNMGQGNTNSTMNLFNPAGSGANIGKFTLNFQNPTTATSGQNYIGPIIGLSYGTYWDGAASQQSGFSAQTKYASGASPLTTFAFAQVGTASGGGAKYTFDAPVFATVFQCKNLDNVRCVDGVNSAGWAGSDVGAWINAAYADLPAPGGEIDVFPTSTGLCYNFTTPISFQTASKFVLLVGKGSDSQISTTSNGTCLNYTPTTATKAISMDYVPSNGGGTTRNHGISNIRLINAQCNTTGGCGSSATGVYLGTVNAGAQNAVWNSFAVIGFGTGISIASPASGSQASWGINFNSGALSYNTTGLAIPNGIELTMLNDMKILGNTTGVSMGSSSDLYMNGGSCDANTTICIVSIGGNITTSAVHYENQGVNTMAQINAGLTLSVTGGFALDDCASAGACGGVTPAYWFNAPLLNVNGLSIFSAGRVPSKVFTYTSSAIVTGLINISAVVPHDNVIATWDGNSIFNQLGVAGQPASLEAGLFMADSSLSTAFTCGAVSDFTTSQFGSTATCSNPEGGMQRFRFEITANGSGIATNPHVLITLPTPWPIAPLYTCKMVGGTVTPGIVDGESSTISTTVIGPLIYNGTPTAGQSIIFGCIGM